MGQANDKGINNTGWPNFTDKVDTPVLMKYHCFHHFTFHIIIVYYWKTLMVFLNVMWGTSHEEIL